MNETFRNKYPLIENSLYNVLANECMTKYKKYTVYEYNSLSFFFQVRITIRSSLFLSCLEIETQGSREKGQS